MRKKKKTVAKKKKRSGLKPLTPKQKLFVEHYLRTSNGFRSALAAGYSKTDASANVAAQRLLQNVSIKNAINKGTKKNLAEAIGDAREIKITKERWLQEVANIAFANMGDFIQVVKTSSGGIRVTLIPDEERKAGLGHAIAEIKQSETLNGGMQSLKLHPKLPALDLLAKHFGWIKERVEQTGAGGGPIQFEEVTDKELDEKIFQLSAIVVKRDG